MDPIMYTLVPLGPAPTTWASIEEMIERQHKDVATRRKIKEAISFLQKVVGKGFFNNCGNNHPIHIKLTSNIHLSDELIEFVDAIRQLKSDDANYRKLLSKLIPRQKCREEGIPFLDVYRRFNKAGFKVNFLEEAVHQKTADIELVDNQTDESIFVEVSQLQQSDHQRMTQSQHRQLSNTFLQYGFDLPKACKQKKQMDQQQMDWAIAQIKRLKDLAAKDQTFEYVEDEFVAVAVAYPNSACLEELDNWCAERGMTRNAVEGLEVNFNDTPRLVDNSKIIGEIKQLPTERPGFVYIAVSALYFFKMNIPDTAVSIMEQLVNFPYCLGVLLDASMMGTLFPVKSIDLEHTIFTVKTVNGIAQHSLFVANPGFSARISLDTVQRFQQSLR